jgi:hypothetical protein
VSGTGKGVNMKGYGRIVVILVILVGAGLMVIGQELPKCPKCQQTIYSSWWKYCPNCGARLPEFQIQGRSADEEVVLGNVYKNTKWLFRIEKPAESWAFKTGKDATTFNGSAIVVMTDKSAYAMVIPEEMADMTMKQYENLVMPKLENKQLVSHKEITSRGIPGIVDEIEGDFEQGQITWKMAIYKDGDNFYQVHCWTLKQTFSKYRKECDLIIQSFKVEKTEEEAAP